MDHQQIAPSPSAPTDGPAVCCPLCEYDLRGLIEPRCPECGHRFRWEELLDQQQNTHAYLFEHHPRRNLWSFGKTLINGLLPESFWQTLRPAMTPRPMRLYLYCLFSTVIPLLLLCTPQLISIAGQRYYPPQRVISLQTFSPNFIRFGLAPRPRLIEFADNLAEPVFPVMVGGWVIILWMVTSLLALLICQSSLRRRRIRTIHVERCVIYSFDCGLIWLVAGAVITALRIWTGNVDGWWVLFFTLVVILICANRLQIAYRTYLAFPHAQGVVLSSQVIAGLIALILLVNAPLRM